VPVFPELPLAVGSASIEMYIDDYPDDAGIELDGRLYPCVLTWVEETPGRECPDDAARTTVHALRDEIDRLFFNTVGISKHRLKNKAVLCSVYLTPGGARMLKKGSGMAGSGRPQQ